MSGDATIQAAIQTLIQALANFANADVTLGDFQVIGRGSAPYAIVLPGAFRARRSGDWSQVQFIWSHPVEVWDRFTGDDYSGVVTARQAVVDQINAYPTLDSTAGISNAYAEASDRPRYLWQRGQVQDSLPAFVGFEVVITSVEEVLYDGDGEFA